MRSEQRKQTELGLRVQCLDLGSKSVECSKMVIWPGACSGEGEKAKVVLCSIGSGALTYVLIGGNLRFEDEARIESTSTTTTSIRC